MPVKMRKLTLLGEAWEVVELYQDATVELC